MQWLLRWLIWAIMRVILACRYKVAVIGKEKVLAKPGPYLILPNHPALADPPNLLVHLWPTFQMRPLLLESNFQNPVLAPFKWLLRAHQHARHHPRQRGGPPPRGSSGRGGDRGTQERRERHPLAERPARRRRRPSSSAARARPPTCWPRCRMPPSCWPARAGCGAACSAGPTATASSCRDDPQGLRALAREPVLFAPRRRVTVTLEPSARTSGPEPTREAVNPWLEEWYNADTPREKPTFVPYHFLFGPRTHEFPPPPSPGSSTSRR